MVDRRSILQSSLALGILSGLHKASAASEPLRVGVMPTLSARIIATQYEPLQAYLSNKLEVLVTLSTGSDVTNFYRNIQSDHYDTFISAAHIARLAQTQHGFVPIANFQPNVKCVIVTLKGAEGFLKASAKKSQISYSDPASMLTFEAEKWLEKQGLKAGTDYELQRVRWAENIGFAVARGEAIAGVMSHNAFLANPIAVREKLRIAHHISEIPAFYVMRSSKLSQNTTAKLVTHFANFSDKSVEGKEFEKRTTFRVTTLIDEKEFAKMDSYLEKTIKILS